LEAPNGVEQGVGTTVPCGSLKGCASPDAGYAGVFDLSGNAYEWEDSCGTTDAGPNDICYLRGSGYPDGGSRLACAITEWKFRNEVYPTVGFRCCSQ
jgi:formylglycine-generating enzyme required for sulfatase activity